MTHNQYLSLCRPSMFVPAARGLKLKNNAAICSVVLVLLAVIHMQTAEGDTGVALVEIISNELTTPCTVQCKSLEVDYGMQTIDSGAEWNMTVITSASDPSVSCVFNAENEKSPQTIEVWNYILSGYSDSPWFTCLPNCSWRVETDGFYYLAANGTYALYTGWTGS